MFSVSVQVTPVHVTMSPLPTTAFHLNCISSNQSQPTKQACMLGKDENPSGGFPSIWLTRVG